jgi:hypothetical protein
MQQAVDETIDYTTTRFEDKVKNVDLVLNTPGLNDEQRIAILGGTAARLLGIGS